MYLFTRSRHASVGDPGGALSWTVETTELVRNVTGHQVDAWMTVLSPDANLVVWSMWAEHLADIEQAGDKLMASSEYLDAVKAGDAVFEGPLVDRLASLVHGDLDLAGDPPNYVAVVTAVAVPGRLSDAISGGIEIADHATRVSGLNTLFAIESTGPYGGCSWITASPDMAAMEAGDAALMSDADWLNLIDRTGTAYNSDAAQAIYRRVI